jgi:bifunctional non-homologous end joining protein LigD
MSLREYQRKRDFDRTAEPKARRAAKGGHSFVVQKHAASHLHYDFRLELDGVLKSWAVPKGPSLDPKVKRLAMHVEDHPVDYGSFEGIIPKGEYGGGTVMLWDRGEWEAVGDGTEGYQSGKLKFQLHGQKLRGRWMLVRTSRGERDGEARQWLLFKELDDQARPAEKGEIIDEMPLSVRTGRSMDEIANDRNWVWNTKESAKKPKARAARPGRHTRTKRAAKPKPGLQTNPPNYNAAAKQFAGVRLTSPEKILYPEEKITKLELAHYYWSIADWILPHLKDRPLVLVRCPEGRLAECFYQKHPAPGSPEALRQIPIREKTKTEKYVIADDAAGLISLAQVAALEIHAWGSRADKLEQPDRLIFDLDPDPRVSWNRVVQAAQEVRRFLEDLGLESFVKTTGGKGLHLVVPVTRGLEWDDVHGFCKGVADLIVHADPSRFTANMAKAARVGKIYIDYVRNGRGATAIVPYSTRARPGATVSTPLTWDELDARVHSDRYTVKNILQRLAALKRDPWEGFAAMRQGLAGPIKAVKALLRSTGKT